MARGKPADITDAGCRGGFGDRAMTVKAHSAVRHDIAASAAMLLMAVGASRCRQRQPYPAGSGDGLSPRPNGTVAANAGLIRHPGKRGLVAGGAIGGKKPVSVRQF